MSSPREYKKLRRDPENKQSIKLHVLGAAGSVTGSMYLVEYTHNDKVTRVLVDAGLHQETPALNWNHRLPEGVSLADINAMVLTHAHIDHSGWIPFACANGFKGSIYTQKATVELVSVMLKDSGYLQELAADRKNHSRSYRNERQQDPHIARLKGSSRNTSWQARPLYTEDDAVRCLEQFIGIKYNSQQEIAHGIKLKLTQAGHILGSAVATLEIGFGNKKRTVVFSGDIGPKTSALVHKLQPITQADYLIVESTYGDRLHPKCNKLEVLTSVINEANERAQHKNKVFGRGVIHFAAFAVQRVQELAFDIARLMEEGKIPMLPVFVDGPMSIECSQIFRKHPKLLGPVAHKLIAEGKDPFAGPGGYIETFKSKQSMRLMRPAKKPFIVITSSGWGTGGRIVNHMKWRLPGFQNTFVFSGFAGRGTPSAILTNPNGKPENIRLDGKTIPVRATIATVPGYSRHRDWKGILSFLRTVKKAPRQVFIVHGEESSRVALKGHIEEHLHWKNVTVPHLSQCFDLV